MSYGVDIENPFTLLGDENDDPIPIVNAQITKTAASPKVPQKKVEAKAAPVNQQAAAEPQQYGRPESGRGRGEGRGRGNGRGGDRGGDRGGRGGRGRGEMRANGERHYDDHNGAPVENGGEGRGYGGRGRREGGGYREGGRGRRDFDGTRPPRREFDRHDGTGRGHEAAKKGGAGKGNWGTEEDAATVEVAKTEPVAAGVEEAVAEVVEVVDVPAEEAAPAEEEKPKEAPELSLEEYEQQVAEKKAALNKTREVASVDMSEFKGMKTYAKKEADEVELGLGLSSRKEKVGEKGKPKKDKMEASPKSPVVETGFRVGADEPRRERGPRPERGGGRGGRGRGEGRGEGRGRAQAGNNGPPRGSYGRGSRDEAAIPIDDNSAFPSLA